MKATSIIIITLQIIVVGLFGDEVKPYSSEEFKFVASLPKDVYASKAKHSHGTLGSFKAVDSSRRAVYMISANQIPTFMSEPADSKTDWKDLLKTNFLGWAKGMNPVSGSLKFEAAKWNNCHAIRFSYKTDGFISEGVTGFHRGIHLIDRGVFYSLSVVSLVSDEQAAEDANKLEKSFMILDHLMQQESK